MDKEAFKLDLKVAGQKYPEFESEYRALGAVDATEFSKELVDLVCVVSAYGLWHAAKEAQAVRNEPMLNIIALAALSNSKIYNDRMIFADLSTPFNVNRSIQADNYQTAAEKYRIVYEDIVGYAQSANEQKVSA